MAENCEEEDECCVQRCLFGRYDTRQSLKLFSRDVFKSGAR